MSDVEDLKIILRAEVDQAIAGLKKAAREGKNAEKDWDGISKSFQANIQHSLSLKNAFSQLSMQVAGGIAIYQLAGKVIQAVGQYAKQSIEEYQGAAESLARLNAQVKATGGAAGFIGNQLRSMAEELMAATKIEHESIEGAQSALMKFTTITGSTFERSIGLALDLSKVLGTDASSAAQTLGKAIEKPAEGFGALRKAGVMLDDSVESNIKKFEDLGEHTKAQNALLDALASRVGGVAAAIGNEDPGKLKSYKIAMSELSEEIGRSISTSGFMTLWHSSIKTIADYWAEALANHNNYKDALNKQNLGVELTTGDRLALAKNELSELKKLQAEARLEAERSGSSYTPYDDAVASAAKRVSQLTKQLELEGDASHNAANANNDFSDKNKLASEYIQKVNNELDKNIQTIKLRALALGKEVTNQDLINQYVEAYVKLIQGSNGLISEANPAAIKLLTTIRELADGFYAFNVAGNKSRGASFFHMDRLSGTLSPEEQAAVDEAAYNAAKAIEDARVEAWEKVSKASGTSFFHMDRLSGTLSPEEQAAVDEAAYNAAKAIEDTRVEAWEKVSKASGTSFFHMDRLSGVLSPEEQTAVDEAAYSAAKAIEDARVEAWEKVSKASGTSFFHMDRLSGVLSPEEQTAVDEAAYSAAKAIEDARVEAWEKVSKASGTSFFLMDRLSGTLSPEEQAAVDEAAYNAAKAIEDARVEAWEKVSKASGTSFFQMDRLSGTLSPEEQAAVDEAAYNAAKAIEDARVEAWEKVSKASGTSFFQMDRLSGNLSSEDQNGIAKALAAAKAYKDGLVKIVGDASSTIDELYLNTAKGSETYTEALIAYLENIKEIAIATNDTSVNIERLDTVIKDLKVSIGKGFDADQFFKDLGRNAKEAAISLASSGIYDTLSAIGGAMASGESSADAFGGAMKRFFASALQQTSMLALNAGLRLIVEGGLPMLPVAIGLLALGGVSAIAAGAISASGQVREVDYDQYIIDPVIEAETDLAKMRASLIEDQLKKERELRDENLKKIEEQFDMEFSVLQDQWERGIISTQEYKDQAAALRANEAAAKEEANAPVKAAEDMLKQIDDAKKQKLSVLSIEGKKLQDELNGMTGWQKFWSGRDEELTAQLKTIDARIEATNKATSLPEISAAKYGADFITSGTRLLKVGDNPGGRERVRVEPIGTPNRYGPSGEAIIIQINAPIYGVDDLYGKLEEAGKKLKRGGRSPVGVFG